MTTFQSIVLGVVQGIGEFLPISSSGHLIVVPWFFVWDDGGLTFDIALHAGTLVALLVDFRQEWVALVRGVLRLRPDHIQNPELLNQDQTAKMGLYVLGATIPGAVMGHLFEKIGEQGVQDQAPSVV